jgi:3-phosphoglycerate kinase
LRDEPSLGLTEIISKNSGLNEMPLESILEAIPTVNEGLMIPSHDVAMIRLDVDLKIKDGRVVDDSRIRAAAETLDFLKMTGRKCVFFGHVGRDPQNSARPICATIENTASHPVEFVEDWLDESSNLLSDEFVTRVKAASPGTFFLLDNTRKYGIETLLWKEKTPIAPGLSSRLHQLAADFAARIGTIEINEGIAASNLDFSSSVLPLSMSKTAMGFFLAREMKENVVKVRNADFVVFSGLKINKLDDLEGIVDRGCLRHVIAAGSLAMALKKAQAESEGKTFCIGRAETDSKLKSFIPSSRVEQAKRIIRKCESHATELILPVDFILDDGTVSETIPAESQQLDVGPQTRAAFRKALCDYQANATRGENTRTVFLNGVFGKFEEPKFEGGTREFVRDFSALTGRGVRTFVGGGEGRLAVERFGSLHDVTHAFTCGGTILKSLTNNHIGFLKAMFIQNTWE